MLVVLAIVVVVLGAGAIYQAVLTSQEKRRYPPPGQMVDVGGHRLHLQVMGEGAPTVILDAGMVSFSSNWAWVQPEVAKVTRVVAHDRAGMGWSDAGPPPRDAGQSVRELHTALEKLGISGPYVLAGHSYGGITVRAFAALYPDEVAGMVLVDGSNPDQWAHMGVSSKVIGFSNLVSAVLARLGFFRVFTGEYRLLTDGLPPQAVGEMLYLAASPRALATGGAELRRWDAVSRPLINEAGDLGDMPLIVLSVTDQPRKGKELTELQNELAKLSTNCAHITVQGATHEGLVAREAHARAVSAAIVRVVEAVRSGKRLETIEVG